MDCFCLRTKYYLSAPVACGFLIVGCLVGRTKGIATTLQITVPLLCCKFWQDYVCQIGVSITFRQHQTHCMKINLNIKQPVPAARSLLCVLDSWIPRILAGSWCFFRFLIKAQVRLESSCDTSLKFCFVTDCFVFFTNNWNNFGIWECILWGHTDFMK